MDNTAAEGGGLPQSLPQNRNSNNPYHKQRQASEDATTIIPSEAPMVPASAVRSRTPVRAVFHDLSTAHSSITSGSARGRKQSASVIGSEESIPLQDLEPRRGRPGADVPQNNNPLPPLPALISREKYNLHHGVHFEPKENFPTDLRERAASDFGRVRQTGPDSRVPALPMAASPVYDSGSSGSFQARHWPRDSLELDINGSARCKSRNNKENSSSQYPDTPAPIPSLKHTVIEDDHGKELLGAEYDGAIQLQTFKTEPVSKSDLSRQLSKQRAEPSSIPESSTIGRIYKSYHQSRNDDTDIDDNEQDSGYDLPVMTPTPLPHRGVCRSRSLSGVQAASSSSVPSRRSSALEVRKQQRAERMMGKPPGQPPSIALPDAPEHANPRIVPSSSEGVHPSTSYGDTRNLLEITQRTGWITKPSNLGNSDYQHARFSSGFVPNASASHNPDTIHRNLNTDYDIERSPQVVISRASSNQFEYDDELKYALLRDNRQPLERDVSQALRRASHFTTYSNGSISSSILNQTAVFQNEPSHPRGAGLVRSSTLADTPQSIIQAVAEDDTPAAEDSTFYAHGALAQNWLDSDRRNVVRVPVNYPGAFLVSPPNSPDIGQSSGQGIASALRRQDEGDDWETVGESGFGLDGRVNKNTTGLLGGTIHRAGSSLANVSDDSSDHTTASPYPELDEFASTERITQHPGRIEYSGDYRQRDLKKTKQPIFLPVYREHKVNGYLADSSRLRAPPNPFNFHPQPLARKHTNPFSGPPPEVMTVNRNQSKPRTFHHARALAASKNPYRFSTDNTSMETDITEQNLPPRPIRKMEPLPVPRVNTETLNWMDAFSDPGPAITPRDKQPRQFLGFETPERPSSWQHVVAFANGEDIPGYNADGTRNFDRAPDSDGFVQTPTYGGLPGANHYACTPFARSPRDTVRGEQGEGSNQDQRKARILTRFHDTNPSQANDKKVLLPISLVEAPRSPTPTPSGRDPNEDVRPHDFFYRSPLAPPKSAEWQAMYERSQLAHMEEYGNTRGIFVTQDPRQPGVMRETGSRKHLWEPPMLLPWSQESPEYPMAYIERRKNISITVLVLCNIFPPLLILYAIGRMDIVMVWWTRGDINSFGRGQKRAAYFLLGLWGFIVVCTLISALIYTLHH